MKSFDENTHAVHLANGKLQNNNLKAVVRHALDVGKPHGTLIQIHGGLVSHKAGVRTAEKLYGKYSAVTNPVFFIWETGAFNAPFNNLIEIICEVAKKKLFNKVSEKARTLIDASFDGGQAYFLGVGSIGEDGLISRKQLEAELKADPEFEEAMEQARDEYVLRQAEILAMRNAKLGTGAPSEPSIVYAAIVSDSTAGELFPASAASKSALFPGFNWWNLAGKIIKVVNSVLARRRSGRSRQDQWRWSITEDVLREFYIGSIGETGWWRPIKKDAADAFRDDAAGGTQFLKELNKQILARGITPRITLVGHSAGSIFICELLNKAMEIMPNLRFDVIFQAPAATCQQFARTIRASSGGAGGSDQIRRFRQLGMLDSDEAAEVMSPLLQHVYHGSLLYFVSNVLEGGHDVPLIGMQRFFSGGGERYGKDEASSIEECKAFYEFHGGGLEWIGKGDCPDLEGPLAHEYFDDGETVIKKVIRILAEDSDADALLEEGS